MAFVSLNCGVGEFTPVVNQSQPLGLASFWNTHPQKKKTNEWNLKIMGFSTKLSEFQGTYFQVPCSFSGFISFFLLGVDVCWSDFSASEAGRWLGGKNPYLERDHQTWWWSRMVNYTTIVIYGPGVLLGDSDPKLDRPFYEWVYYWYHSSGMSKLEILFYRILLQTTNPQNCR